MTMYLSESDHKFWKSQGYYIGHLEDKDQLLDQINADVRGLIDSGQYKTNSRIYSYNGHPRIVEAWRHSSSVHWLAYESQICRNIELLTGHTPRPFSTINFIGSTQQPLHSDYVHFGTVPDQHLVAVWVALEDIDPRSGPLQVVPRSHLLAPFEYRDLGLDLPMSLGDLRRNYSLYEEFVASILPLTGLSAIAPPMNRGDYLIWQANLLHGSPSCENPLLTRRSQVTHYHYASTERFYNPGFSVPSEDHLVDRNVTFIPPPTKRKGP